VSSAGEHSKLKIMTNLRRPEEKLVLTHDQMHRVFIFVKHAIARLMLKYTGYLPGAPKPSEIVDVAIQSVADRAFCDFFNMAAGSTSITATILAGSAKKRRQLIRLLLHCDT
jgi:hypothetical protein